MRESARQRHSQNVCTQAIYKHTIKSLFSLSLSLPQCHPINPARKKNSWRERTFSAVAKLFRLCLNNLLVLNNMSSCPHWDGGFVLLNIHLKNSLRNEFILSKYFWRFFENVKSLREWSKDFNQIQKNKV